jgi:hypothetical protein
MRLGNIGTFTARLELLDSEVMITCSGCSFVAGDRGGSKSVRLLH